MLRWVHRQDINLQASKQNLWVDKVQVTNKGVVIDVCNTKTFFEKYPDFREYNSWDDIINETSFYKKKIDRLELIKWLMDNYNPPTKK